MQTFHSARKQGNTLNDQPDQTKTIEQSPQEVPTGQTWDIEHQKEKNNDT